MHTVRIVYVAEFNLVLRPNRRHSSCVLQIADR